MSKACPGLKIIFDYADPDAKLIGHFETRDGAVHVVQRRQAHCPTFISGRAATEFVRKNEVYGAIVTKSKNPASLEFSSRNKPVYGKDSLTTISAACPLTSFTYDYGKSAEALEGAQWDRDQSDKNRNGGRHGRACIQRAH